MTMFCSLWAVENILKSSTIFCTVPQSFQDNKITSWLLLCTISKPLLGCLQTSILSHSHIFHQIIGFSGEILTYHIVQHNFWKVSLPPHCETWKCTNFHKQQCDHCFKLLDCPFINGDCRLPFCQKYPYRGLFLYLSHFLSKIFHFMRL